MNEEIIGPGQGPGSFRMLSRILQRSTPSADEDAPRARIVSLPQVPRTAIVHVGTCLDDALCAYFFGVAQMLRRRMVEWAVIDFEQTGTVREPGIEALAALAVDARQRRHRIALVNCSSLLREELLFADLGSSFVFVPGRASTATCTRDDTRARRARATHPSRTVEH